MLDGIKQQHETCNLVVNHENGLHDVHEYSHKLLGYNEKSEVTSTDSHFDINQVHLDY